VLDAAAAMEWVPGGAVELRTDDYRLIRYPDYGEERCYWLPTS
jgi:hypothetical protein